MIVLKASQDKVLAILQSVSGIVERRHPAYEDGYGAWAMSVLEGRVAVVFPTLYTLFFSEYKPSSPTDKHSAMAKKKNAPGVNLSRFSYFESKVNGRNAP